MTTERRVAVTGYGAFVPGYPGLSGWLAAQRDPELEKPKAALVPARQRRRASVLSKALAEAFAEALTMSGAVPSDIASVFGSAMGEASTMIGLLDQMWSETAMLSPMKFATSVHNAASGVVSIATENRGFTTSLGADFDTPAMSLLEGIGLVLAENQPVIVCCGDEPPPNELTPGGEGWPLMAAAIALAPVDSAPAGSLRLSNLRLASTTSPGGDEARPRRIPPAAPEKSEPSPEALSRNPCVGLLDLAAALAKGETGELMLDRGEGRGFSVRIEAPAE